MLNMPNQLSVRNGPVQEQLEALEDLLFQFMKKQESDYLQSVKKYEHKYPELLELKTWEGGLVDEFR